MKSILILTPPRCDREKLRIPDAFNFLELGFSEYLEYLKKKRVNVKFVDLNYEINGSYNFAEGQKNKRYVDLTFFSDDKNYKTILKHILDFKKNKIIDEKIKKISNLIYKKDIDLFCILLGWPSRVLIGLCIAKHLKENTQKKVILSGPINNIFFDEPFNIKRLTKLSFINFVIKKPGKNLIKIYKLLEEGKLHNKYIKGVPSVFLKENNKIINTLEIDNEIDLNKLPAPVYNHLENKRVELLPYEISKGCPNHCFYCFYVNEPFLFKKVNKVVKEIKYLKNKYNCNNFYLNTTAINFSKEYLNKLLDVLEKENLNIKWLSYIYPQGLDYTTLKRMYDVGCRMIDMGIEQGSESNIRIIKRKASIKEVSSILKNCKKIGICTYVAFIIGIPYLKEEVKYIKSFLKEYGKYMGFFFMNQFDIHYVNIKNCKKIWGENIKIFNNKIDSRHYPFLEKGYNSFLDRVKTCDKKEKEIIDYTKKIGVNFRRCKSRHNEFKSMFDNVYLYVLKNKKNSN